MITVGIVEDHREFRETLENYISATAGFQCVCTCASAEEAFKRLHDADPDVVLMDLHLPVRSGIECTRRVKEQCPRAQVVILTVYDDKDRIFKALKAGASGYLLKRTDPAEILSAIKDITEGGVPMTSQIARKLIQSFREPEHLEKNASLLTDREKNILRDLSRGSSTKEIAISLCISVNTVWTHLQHIYQKLHVRSRTEAVIKFMSQSDDKPGIRGDRDENGKILIRNFWRDCQSCIKIERREALRSYCHPLRWPGIGGRSTRLRAGSDRRR